MIQTIQGFKIELKRIDVCVCGVRGQRKEELFLVSDLNSADVERADCVGIGKRLLLFEFVPVFLTRLCMGVLRRMPLLV